MENRTKERKEYPLDKTLIYSKMYHQGKRGVRRERGKSDREMNKKGVRKNVTRRKKKEERPASAVTAKREEKEKKWLLGQRG